MGVQSTVCPDGRTCSTVATHGMLLSFGMRPRPSSDLPKEAACHLTGAVCWHLYFVIALSVIVRRVVRMDQAALSAEPASI